MLEYLIVCTVALVASCLTFFSGFGLGTLLMPVFALFFPIDIAIALTAVVHFLNNLFKLTLIGSHTNWKIVIRFGIPAILSALLGAYLLTLLTGLKPLFNYTIGEHHFDVMPIKLIIGVIIIFFVLFDSIPFFSRRQFNSKYLVLGGIISGFFGGLSGNQGALRSAFLVKSDFTKEAFIATGVVIACIIDITRLMIYSEKFVSLDENSNYPLLLSATLCAFLGAYAGSKFIRKITFSTIKTITAIFLIFIGLLFLTGVL